MTKEKRNTNIIGMILIISGIACMTASALLWVDARAKKDAISTEHVEYYLDNLIREETDTAELKEYAIYPVDYKMSAIFDIVDDDVIETQKCYFELKHYGFADYDFEMYDYKILNKGEQ